MKIGIQVTCTTCMRTKAPRGRSIPNAIISSMCDSNCVGFWNDPKPGDLWPGETEEDFGYPCSKNATKETITK
jgi:hypothetical protein